MTWKMKVCCDQMEDCLNQGYAHIDVDDPYAYIHMSGGRRGVILFCPQCGRHIEFKREED